MLLRVGADVASSILSSVESEHLIPLSRAIELGLELAAILGVKKNIYKHTLLHLACLCRDPATTVAILPHLGAAIDVSSVASRHKLTPLRMAARLKQGCALEERDGCSSGVSHQRWCRCQHARQGWSNLVTPIPEIIEPKRLT